MAEVFPGAVNIDTQLQTHFVIVAQTKHVHVAKPLIVFDLLKGW